jgi:hypothetical protein
MGIGTRLRGWAREIRKDVVALHIAARDSRLPFGHVDEVIILLAAIAMGSS